MSLLNKIQQVRKTLAARAAARAAVGQRRLREGGFNLIEIMIVLAIISMLMGAAGFGGFALLEKARRKETRNMMHQIENALVQFQTEGSETCPSALTDLVTKKILNKEPKDGWGRPYIFKCPGEHGNEIDLTSLGKDGKEGTADDMHSWEDDEAPKK